MIWHIAKRELSDNLNSLRFALATVLLLGLMLTNAVVHLREHPERVKRYREDASKYQNHIASHAANSLYDLAQEGPGDLYKKTVRSPFLCRGWRSVYVRSGIGRCTTVGVPTHSKVFGY